MPHTARLIRFSAMLAVGALLMLGGSFRDHPAGRAQTAATPTPYHQGVPVASRHVMEPPRYPLPGPQDRASADAMAAGATAMIHMAQVMDAAATLLLNANDTKLVGLGQHWVLNGQALRQQAAWMVLSATAADMIHDPAAAHELNARNLKGNGLAMTAEGQAMTEHGRAMTTEVEQIRAAGALAPDIADQLIAAGEELAITGKDLARDGQRMQDEADDMLTLIGQ